MLLFFFLYLRCSRFAVNRLRRMLMLLRLRGCRSYIVQDSQWLMIPAWEEQGRAVISTMKPYQFKWRNFLGVRHHHHNQHDLLHRRGGGRGGTLLSKVRSSDVTSQVANCKWCGGNFHKLLLRPPSSLIYDKLSSLLQNNSTVHLSQRLHQVRLYFLLLYY